MGQEAPARDCLGGWSCLFSSCWALMCTMGRSSSLPGRQ
jgi:hypothetical protein